MPKKLTKEIFIKKANKIHNSKYNYDNTIYINNKTSIIINCNIHGEFKQRPDSHLNGSGCPRCIKVNNYKDFIIKANKIHHNKYEYSEFIWNNYKDKIDIICNKHGKFTQIINDHLNGSGCPKCNKRMLDENDFNKVTKINKEKYDYSNTIFRNNSKIKIICKKHGEFEQNIWYHFNGSGCPKCSHKNLNASEFIELFNIVHNYTYDYSKTEYIRSNKKIKIICKKHGEFEQTPNHHLNGQGCPFCKSSKGEKEIRLFLEKNNIKFVQQQTFKNCKYKQNLFFDFYLPNHNICIEYDGILHFKSVKYFGGEKKLKLTQLRDKIKTDFCHQNNIELIRIRYNQNVLNKLNEILEKRNLY